MPEPLRYVAILVIGLWAIWYFARMIWVGLFTGKLIDSRPWDGVPVTRQHKPVAFWFSIVIGGVCVPAFLWLAINLVAHLLGWWEFRFDA
jgi:hypothetical protein